MYNWHSRMNFCDVALVAKSEQLGAPTVPRRRHAIGLSFGYVVVHTEGCPMLFL